MSIYPSLERLKLDMFMAQRNYVSLPTEACSPPQLHMNAQSLKTLYPILNGYLGLELDIKAQQNCVVNSTDQPSARTKDGVRKLILGIDHGGHEALKLSRFNQNIFVRYIKRNSIADLSGLRFGQQLLQVNDTFVSGMSLKAVNEIFQEYSRSHIEVIIRNRPLERSINLCKSSTDFIGFEIKNGRIISVNEGSEAACNGVLKDHQLLEVNGKFVIDMNDEQIKDLFTNSPGMINITIIPGSIYNHMIKKIAPSLDEEEEPFNTKKIKS